jgi:hypothetical protein
MTGLILLGNKRDLLSEDLWSLDKREESEFLTEKLESKWSKVANK